MIKILIVDDEKPICDLIDMNLSAGGYQCAAVQDGIAALRMIEEEAFDLILLDIMLPGEDGLELLKKLKNSAKTKDIPVIMVTAKGAEYDKVIGLDSGADDYVTKPFGMMEFLARVKAVLRRSKKHSSKKEYHYKTLTVNVERHQVFDNDRAVELTLKEFELLRYLVENKGIVLSRDEILEKIWGYECAGETRTVDVHIRTLRQKLGDSGFLIETVRGVGYRIGDSQ